LRNLYAAAADLHAGFTHGDHVAFVHVVVASRRRAIASAFVPSVLAGLAAPRLNTRLERTWSMPPGHAALTSTVAVDEPAASTAQSRR